MAKKNDTIDLMELLLKCMSQPDPMLSMLEWLCKELMEAEVSAQLGAKKNVHSEWRSSSRSGYRPRRLDTRMGTMYLMIPQGALRRIHPVLHHGTQAQRGRTDPDCAGGLCAGCVYGKMDKLAGSLGIEGLSRTQVSEMTKGLNEQAEAFRNRSLAGGGIPDSVDRCTV